MTTMRLPAFLEFTESVPELGIERGGSSLP